MEDFTKASQKGFSQEGRDLSTRISLAINYYKSISTSNTASLVATRWGYIPGIDSFLDSFIKHYLSEKEFRDSLLVQLMTGYVAKVDGAKNAAYGAKVLNFCLALAAGGNKKAFEFVSGNLALASLRHMQRVMAKKKDHAFINIGKEKMVELVANRISMIRSGLGDESRRIAFSVGIDATCVVKGHQICADYGMVVGGASPNHCMSIAHLTSGEDVKSFLKECNDGKHGELAAEVKIAVVSFQTAAAGTCPYFALVGLPQTINESNDFGATVLEACTTAAKNDGNAVLLNESTDGVSCETKWNLSVALLYLDGKTNCASLPDTNHNVKCARGHLVGGASPSSIGMYVVDPCMFKISGVTTDHFRIQDFASDALPLRLASCETVSKLISCNFPDVGNCAATIVSLTFLRLRSYAVNARNIKWKDRAVYTWASLLWFTSFHTPGSTMIANKRNMLLETVGLLFLVTRCDVSQSRRITSECNEHTYGMYRMHTREFNVEQLIRINQKTDIRLGAIFESDLVTTRSNSSFKGYQRTTPEFLESMKSDSSADAAGPVDVDLEKPAVDQLWDEVKGIIDVVNACMVPFLKLFGVEDGNGLSPFATNVATPNDLKKMIEQFFRRTKQDPRGRSSNTADESGR